MRCLTGLKLFPEAFALFKGLILGDRLPNLYDADFQKVDRFETVEVEVLKFDPRERILNSLMNFKVLLSSF